MRARQTHDRYASLTWLIIVMTVVVLVIGTIAARYVESRLVASKGESLALAAAEIAHKLDLLLAEQYHHTLELSRTYAFRSRDAAALPAHLATVMKTHPMYLWLGVADAKGRIVAATDPASIGRDYSGSSWFQAAREMGTEVGDVEPNEETGGTDAVSFTAPIRGAGGKFQGAVTARVGLPALEEVVARTIRTFQTREESRGTLEYKFLTAAGIVFVDSDLFHKGNIDLKRLGLPSALLSESDRAGYLEEEHLQRHVPVVTGYARTQGAGEFPGLKWTVLLRTDKDDLVAPIRSVLWKLAAAWVLVWLPMLGFSLWSAGRLKEEWTHAQDGHALAATAESKYRQLVDQARDIIYRADDQGRFTFVNPIVTRIMGYSPQELLGRRFLELIRPDARAAAERFYGWQFVRKTPSTYYEFPAIAKDGREVWIGQHVQALLENGRVAGFHAVARDITERKQTEEARRESEIQMRLFMEATADCIWNWDLVAAHVTRNVGFQRLFGYAEEEIVPTIDWWAERLHPDDRERVWATYGDAVANGRATCTYEYRFRRRDGSYAIVSDHVFIVRDSTGKVVRALGAMTDITERKRAEEVRERLVTELAESRNRFEMFFRQTPSAISITTVKEGRFLDVNKQAEILTGYPREELIGRTTVEMNLYVDPTERPKLVQVLKERGVITDLERQIRTRSGEIRTAVFSLVPIQIGSEPCLLSIAHDITERKRAERKLRERSRQQSIEAELSLLAATVPDLPSLLDIAAKLASNALEADYCEVLELLPNGSELRLHASAGWKSDRIGQVRTAEAGTLAHAALQSKKPVIRALPDNARFGGPPWLHEHGAVGGMNVSIPGKESPWGVLGVYTAGGRAFSHDDVNFLQTVSSILATAIERMQAESVLRSANQALRLLSRQLLQVQEDDRRAIARDLHDEIGQSLTAIKLNVERAQRTSDRDARTRIMQDCAQITERVLGQVRDLSLDLHPSILDDLGLAYALRWYADRQAERAGLKVEVTADPSLPRLPPDIEIACFRIAQEALTNVVRHARASQAGIILKRLAERVELRIQDDGIGFDVKTVQSPMGGGTSIGLTGMRERARLVGGEVHVTSDLKKGTEVTAIVPLRSVPSADTLTPQAPPP